jgi:hypothetical protein
MTCRQQRTIPAAELNSLDNISDAWVEDKKHTRKRRWLFILTLAAAMTAVSLWTSKFLVGLFS